MYMVMYCGRGCIRRCPLIYVSLSCTIAVSHQRVFHPLYHLSTLSHANSGCTYALKPQTGCPRFASHNTVYSSTFLLDFIFSRLFHFLKIKFRFMLFHNMYLF